MIRASRAARMRRVTLSLRTAALALAAAALAGPLAAQTPTPTPTATPTPIPFLQIPGSAASLGIPNGGRYDASNLLLKPDGTIWTASANENVIARISPDGKIRKWAMPKDAAPSHLLEEPDGTFWVAQLGGFKVSRFDPQSGELTEWADAARRPTAFVKRADGTLWLPHTNGVLTTFDPATSTFVYWRTTDPANPLVSLSYPWPDADGSVWAGDFVRGGIVRIAPDARSATRWQLPNSFVQPSKVIRGPDGLLWISFHGSAQLARFDPATAELKTVTVGAFVRPFDLKVYRNRIVYTEQYAGEVGVLDPFADLPAETATLESKQLTLTSTTEVATPTKTTLTTTDVAVDPASPVVVAGFGSPGLSRYPALSGIPYGLAIDEVRKRFLVGATGEVAEILPPLPVTVNDHLYPWAASTDASAGGWATEVVAWNRGTPNEEGNRSDAKVDERVLPSDWIVGFSPATTLTIGPGKLVRQADPIGVEMKEPNTTGALRLSPPTGTTNFGDVFSWARVYRKREDGGTRGMARNRLTGGEAVSTGETGFLFAPPDVDGQRVDAGLLVVEAARFGVSIVGPDGNRLAGPASIEWPAGFQTRTSSIFEAFGIAPAASARVVFAVEKGRILPFGSSTDTLSGDPVDLPFFGPLSTAAVQWFLAVERGGGPLGPTSRTDFQLHNGAGADSTVSLGFRPARLVSSEGPVPGPRFAALTVPAGRTVTVKDAVKELFGLEGVAGSVDVVSEPPVFAFTRVTAADPAGGRNGYGNAAVLGNVAADAASRALFIQATDAGWDVMESELQVTNPTDDPARVNVRAFDFEGEAVGEPLPLEVAPKEVLRIPAAFYTVSGRGADIGRLEVAPEEGSPPVFAVLVRQDKKTGDADAVVPYVIPKVVPAS